LPLAIIFTQLELNQGLNSSDSLAMLNLYHTCMFDSKTTSFIDTLLLASFIIA